jgi:hypothetical protein
VTDRTDQGRSVRDNARRPLFATGQSRFLTVVICLVVILVITVGGHLYGRYLASRDLGGRDAAIVQLTSEGEKLKRQMTEKDVQISTLQAKLKNVQATLDAIMPAENTYNVTPNQSVIVGDGRLTIGLVGSPGNEGVTLNINGKQQTVAAGQVVTVAADASTNCQLAVQSFDMFRAIVNASCASAKPQ